MVHKNKNGTAEKCVSAHPWDALTSATVSMQTAVFFPVPTTTILQPNTGQVPFISLHSPTPRQSIVSLYR